jgi:hypothetical protein
MAGWRWVLGTQKAPYEPSPTASRLLWRGQTRERDAPFLTSSGLVGSSTAVSPGRSHPSEAPMVSPVRVAPRMVNSSASAAIDSDSLSFAMNSDICS